MLIRRGWNSYLDAMRDDLWQLHPRINVVDFDFFSLDVFNQCDNSRSVLMTIDAWAGVPKRFIRDGAGNMGKQLVAYYSRRGQNFAGGEIRNLAVGNTEIAAELVQVLTQADIFRIEPAREYSPDYCRCIDQARQDLLHGVRPELKAWPGNWETYDTVYLGYPNHWNTLPVAVFSFVERLDWFGKTIRPFCIHEWSGMGRSEADLRKACPAAHIAPGLPLRGADVRRELAALADWLEEGL